MTSELPVHYSPSPVQLPDCSLAWCSSSSSLLDRWALQRGPPSECPPGSLWQRTDWWRGDNVVFLLISYSFPSADKEAQMAVYSRLTWTLGPMSLLVSLNVRLQIWQETNEAEVGSTMQKLSINTDQWQKTSTSNWQKCRISSVQVLHCMERCENSNNLIKLVALDMSESIYLQAWTSMMLTGWAGLWFLLAMPVVVPNTWWGKYSCETWGFETLLKDLQK